MKFFIRFLQCVIAALLIQGCNNDIFVNPDDDPGDISAVMGGDGDTADFRLSTKNLKVISVNDASDNVTYYDVKGNESKESPDIEYLSRIVLDSFLFSYEITYEGDRLTVHTISNASGDQKNILLCLYYSYGSRFINIEVEPGQDVELVDVSYGQSIFDHGRLGENRSLTYSNFSGYDEVINVCPYISATSRCLVTPILSWANYLQAKIRIPQRINGEWEYSVEQDVKLDSPFYMPLAELPDRIPVQVKNGETVIVKSYVTVESVSSYGHLEFRNPVTGVSEITPFNTTVYTPVDYVINIEHNS